jgi:hypothetical protein
MIRWHQFSLRSLLSLVAALAISLATILQIPHWFVFGLSIIGAILASLAVYRARTNSRLRLLTAAALPAWLAFYILSLGPFIALSEFDRRITGQHHLARLAQAYVPVMRLNHLTTFRWYMSQWTPADAIGLHELCPSKFSPELVGTWQTGTAIHVNLRADGTGRAIDRAGDKTKVLYFEWTSDANEFAIYQYASKRSAPAWFGHEAMSYAPTDSYDLVEVSEPQFKLRDKAGAIHSPTRTQDKELESSP